MWFNRENYNGISVLNYDGGTYKQAPFEEISSKRYKEMISQISEIDLTEVQETEDGTDLNQQIACAGGVCEIAP
jgi:ribonucleoside-diphosphate reductase alpha chain